jgi:hypothetical protein
MVAYEGISPVTAWGTITSPATETVMARKATNGATKADNKGGPNGTSTVGTGRGAKTRAVEEALSKGIASPTKIAEYVQATHGITITTAHVSAIKASLKDRKGKRKGKKQKASVAAGAAAPPVQRTGTGNGLSPGDLADLANLAEKAGSVGRLREYLEVLGRVR